MSRLPVSLRLAIISLVLTSPAWLAPGALRAQGVTTSSMSGLITEPGGNPVNDATVVATHLPSGTSYRALTRGRGNYVIQHMRVGGPYRVQVTMIGYQPKTQDSVFLSLGQNMQVNIELQRQAVQLAEIAVTGEEDRILNGGRTGAATFVTPEQVTAMPTIKRSTRDLTRLDPRSDGNYSFGGRNWLYNNVSLDGSYFNNAFGLDDPAPGGQSNAEPVPYDAVEQVQVSLSPFDVTQGGFTGANINIVTRSGTNTLRGTVYTFLRNEDFQGNEVSGSPVVANPSLSYLQSGFGIGGALKRDKLFFYLNAEMERTDDPGSNFVACTGTCTGTQPLGVSRVRASTMDSISQRLATYGYTTGAYQGYIHESDNDKLLARIDWNINQKSNLMFRYNFLTAHRDLPPHPFVLSVNNTGRGPNSSSLPFVNSGYAINNRLHSFAFEHNYRSTTWANKFFASYNSFRDHRTPFSADFPTIEIGEGGVTYTTAGHEPFSIHNILNTDVLQVTNNATFYRGSHTLTLGANFEKFSFFNSFNIFRHGLFQNAPPGGTTYATVQDFFNRTDPALVGRDSLTGFIGSGPYKGEDISAGQLSFYAQDELLLNSRFTLTMGLRMDLPMYFTDMVDNPYSRGLTALDENRQPETVDQSTFPGSSAMFSPRLGFNWNAAGNRSTQVRGGTGVFTGRVPFVWVGNVVSNPANNPNLWGPFNSGAPQIPQGGSGDSSILQQSFDLNAMAPDFRWPQVWTTDIAVDQQLPWQLLGTLEFIYSKDLNAVFMRNADLIAPTDNLADGRPFYGCVVFGANCRPGSTAGDNENNGGDFGAGMYVIDNTSEGYAYSVSAQLRRSFGPNVSASLGYTYLQARNNLKSTEIASVLWQNQPIQGDPNQPGLSFSEFGQRHRLVGTFTYAFTPFGNNRTQIGAFFEVAEGNRFSGAGGNRYSFIYAGDVNGDGYGGNDLIYIPAAQSEIELVACATACGANTTPAQQWTALDAFINQDAYLSSHRGQIAERHGALNPWYHTMDVRLLQDIQIKGFPNRHGLQFSLDVLNFTNLINSSWGVRKVANPAATSPLTLVGWNGATGEPQFNFTGPSATYVDDPGVLSRWRIQLGLRYMFN